MPLRLASAAAACVAFAATPAAAISIVSRGRADRLRRNVNDGATDGEGGEGAGDTEKEDKGHSCGLLKTPPNSQAVDYDDGRETKLDEVTKKQVPNLHYAGAEIPLKCDSGFSIDGSRDGPREFNTVCSDAGYYKPEGRCLEASKCGMLPNITHAHPTGKVVKRVGMPVQNEYTCVNGYSLDGEKIVPGGLQKNQLFSIECDATGLFSAPTSAECIPFSFTANGEIAKTYGAVFEALWHVTCKNTLTSHATANVPGSEWEPPASLDTVCDQFADDAWKKADCDTLLTKAKEEVIDVEEGTARDKNGSLKDMDERTAAADKVCKGLYKLHKTPTEEAADAPAGDAGEPCPNGCGPLPTGPGMWGWKCRDKTDCMWAPAKAKESHA